MSEKTTVNLVILHESELRIAAKALAAVVEAQNTEDNTEFSRLMYDALNACIVALHSVHENPDCCLLLTATDALLPKPGKSRKRKP